MINAEADDKREMAVIARLIIENFVKLMMSFTILLNIRISKPRGENILSFLTENLLVLFEFFSFKVTLPII